MKQWKRRRTARSLWLAGLLACLILAIVSCAGAEASTPWRADLASLLNDGEIPATTSIKYDLNTPEGAAERRHSVQLVSSKGDVLNVEVVFELVDLPLTESQWSEVTDWLKQSVTASVQSVRADSESLASVVAGGIADGRKAAQAAGSTEPWASERLMVKEVNASVPWFPTLKPGDSGTAVQRLQRRLIELGFLSGGADGHYGSNTKKAVQSLEGYVRALEQDLIDTRPDPTATPVPTATPTPAPYVVPLSIEVPILTPEPTVEPSPTPATAVDGVADPLLQAYLYSDHFKVTRGGLRTGAYGDQVERVQARLQNLGYLSDVPDGHLGSSTGRALRIFQYYNHLTQTGIADIATQEVLFSPDAVQPDNAMLSQGASGEAVTKLQKALRTLGFASLNVDGSYGPTTKVAVENLQKYMQAREAQTVSASTGSAPAEDQLTTVVNGVADPLLLEEFYSASFPAIPAAMNSGDTGQDVVRVQRRLSMLEYYYGSLDGEYGSGTMKAVDDFQRQHKLSRGGSADIATLQMLFSDRAQKALKPYVLKVSVADQRVYAYGLDDNNEYTDLVRTMKCSTGRKSTPTPTGTFESGTGPGASWHYFKKFNCWAQYAYYIQGDIMFHSVLYGSKGGAVTRSSVNNLGSRASHGCVRLSVDDAHWIWSNCPRNTKVIVY